MAEVNENEISPADEAGGEHLYYNSTDIDLVSPGKPSPKNEPVIVLIPTSGHRFKIIKSSGNKKFADIHIRSLRLILALYINSASAQVIQLRFKGSDDKGVDELVSHIRALHVSAFPNIPLPELPSAVEVQQEIVSTASLGVSDEVEFGFKLGILPPERLAAFKQYYPQLSEKQSIGVCGGFSKAYLSMCDYYSMQPNQELVWLIENDLAVTKTLVLHQINSLESADLHPVFAALDSNKHFEAVAVADIKLTPEASAAYFAMVKRNQTLKELILNGNGLSKEFFARFAEALMNTYQVTRISSLDLSHNSIDEKSAVILSAAVVRLPLCLNIKLANCSLTKKAAVNFLAGLRKSPQENNLGSNMSLNVPAKPSCTPLTESLLNLDLSHNSVGSEALLPLSEFLAQPNVLKRLNLSQCGIPNLEILFGALLRGSALEIHTLILDGNKFSSNDSQSVGAFLKACQMLKELDLSSCKLSSSVLEILLQSIQGNGAIQSLAIRLRNNDFGESEAEVLKKYVPSLVSLTSIDLSENHFDGDSGLSVMLDALKGHPTLASVNLSRVFMKSSLAYSKRRKSVSNAGTPRLKDLLAVPKLANLNLSENGLKDSLVSFLNSLFSEDDSNGLVSILQSLDISGNELGDSGALTVGKLVMSNSTLRELNWDKNGVSLSGWATFAKCLTHNRSLTYVSIPIIDFAVWMKSNPDKTQQVLDEIQTAVSRNGVSITPTRAENVLSPVSVDSKASFSFKIDGTFSISQQEHIDRAILQLRKHINQLDEAQRKTAVSEDQRALNAETVQQSNAVIDDVNRYAVLLEQLAYLVETSIEKVQFQNTKLTSEYVEKLCSSGKLQWSKVKEDLTEKMLTTIPAILGVADDEEKRKTMFEKSRAQLNLLLQVSASDGLEIEVLQNAISNGWSRDFKAKTVESYSNLLNVMKVVTFDKMVSKLEEAYQEIAFRIDETEKGTAPVTMRRTTRKSISAHNEVDMSSLDAASAMVMSKPLTHINKGRVRPSSARTMPSRQPSRNLESQAVSVMELIPSQVPDVTSPNSIEEKPEDEEKETLKVEDAPINKKRVSGISVLPPLSGGMPVLKPASERRASKDAAALTEASIKEHKEKAEKATLVQEEKKVVELPEDVEPISPSDLPATTDIPEPLSIQTSPVEGVKEDKITDEPQKPQAPPRHISERKQDSHVVQSSVENKVQKEPEVIEEELPRPPEQKKKLPLLPWRNLKYH